MRPRLAPLVALLALRARTAGAKRDSWATVGIHTANTVTFNALDSTGSIAWQPSLQPALKSDDTDEESAPGSAAMRFEAPVEIGHHYFWANGMMAMSGGVALGQAEGSLFYTTRTSGASWGGVSLNTPKAGGASPLTEATVLSADGKTLHDVSGVAAGAAGGGGGGNKTSFNASTSCFFTAHDNGTFSATVKAQQIVFRGLPRPSSSIRTDGRGYVRLGANSLVMSIILDWGIVAYSSTDGGFGWDYIGTILTAAAAPHSEEGPNENDLALMSDGSIICVIRLDGGDGRKVLPPDMKAHHMLPYVKTVSTDGGKTWSKPVSLVDTRGMMMGCARPRLLGLTGGGVVLSGGRLNRTNHENMLWVNAAGDGVAWEAISVSYVHNALEPNGTLHFGASVNNSNARISTSYTSLVATGSRSGYIVYSRLLPSPSVAFALRFTLVSNGEK